MCIPITSISVRDNTLFIMLFLIVFSTLGQKRTISGIDPWLFIPFQVSGMGFRERDQSVGGDLEISLAFAD